MSQDIRTPAARDPRPTVAVLGAGIAGLTAAHELAERGFDVTVYEAHADERGETGSAGSHPPIRLGGLAASQYSTAHGSGAELRPFPGRRGSPPVPTGAVPGEHGFRFFPGYYAHIWDLFSRTPLYQRTGELEWRPTSRTMMDNIRQVVTMGVTADGEPSVVLAREIPLNSPEFLAGLPQLAGMGFVQSDVQNVSERLLRFVATSPARRATELQNVSAYDFFLGRNDETTPASISYSPSYDAMLQEAPRVLAAFDLRWGDARTTLATFLQLQLRTTQDDKKADGVLNGPTTEAWFDHWYRHLVELGVRFVRASVNSLEPNDSRVGVALDDGTIVAPDYIVVAVDAAVAESITAKLRARGTGGTVAKLDGFTTSLPPTDGPLQPAAARPQGRRDPHATNEMGRVPWDRFQTLSGIQYYFDTQFELLRGHVYYTGSEWGLSSINQHAVWARRPTLARDGYISLMSVDIGDFNAPSGRLGKAAYDCTTDEIAAEVWRQMVTALTDDIDDLAAAALPWPAWYRLDRGLVAGEGGLVRNETPYLVPIVGDWPNRPSADPWNPNSSNSAVIQDVSQSDNVWQAEHGGYQVHHDSVVFAGTWNKTFTRITTMEAACESGRHAVNAVLDHYIWAESGGADRRGATTLRWQSPFGVLDEGSVDPVRMPTPAGDYCFVFDIEDRELAEARPLRDLDAQRWRDSRPHPLQAPDISAPTDDIAKQLVSHLQAWRRLLEQPATLTTAGPASDYPDELLGYLRSWREHLEQQTQRQD